MVFFAIAGVFRCERLISPHLHLLLGSSPPMFMPRMRRATSGPLSDDRLAAVTVRSGITSNIPFVELRPWAGAISAFGHWRAEWLDRDAAGRATARRGGDAGAGRQRRAAASPRYPR